MPTDYESAFDMEADEPLSFGLLESVAVELGAPGILAVLLLFLHWAGAGVAGFAATGSASADARCRRMLCLAALGAAVGALTFSVFANPVLRGVGGSMAFFFALALQMWQQSQPAAVSETGATPQPATPTAETAAQP
jgi:hypothetical protein